MVAKPPPALDALYLADETAWLDAMADLIARGRTDELDYAHLGEYLRDMANRDRKEVASRMTVLLAHLLKWQYQPEKRTGSWKATILQQSFELEEARTGVLRAHAEAVLPNVYAKAVRYTAAETELPPVTFPAACPYTVEQLLNAESLLA